MTTVHIRRAELGDLELLSSFNLALALESEQLELDADTVREGVRACLNSSHKGEYWLAQWQGPDAEPSTGSTAHAQLMLTREWSDWRNAWFWWIQSVYVAPTHRRLGLFRCLFEHIRELAHVEGACALRLYVHEHNRSAMDTYFRLGFERSEYALLTRPSDPTALGTARSPSP